MPSAEHPASARRALAAAAGAKVRTLIMRFSLWSSNGKRRARTNDVRREARMRVPHVIHSTGAGNARCVENGGKLPISRKRDHFAVVPTRLEGSVNSGTAK